MCIGQPKETSTGSPTRSRAQACRWARVLGRVSFDCDFIGGGRPGFPDARGPSVWWGEYPIKRLVVVVEFGVTAAAHKRHFVDVGLAGLRCVKWGDVMGLAAPWAGSALNTAAISGDEGSELGWGC